MLDKLCSMFVKMLESGQKGTKRICWQANKTVQIERDCVHFIACFFCAVIFSLSLCVVRFLAFINVVTLETIRWEKIGSTFKGKFEVPNAFPKKMKHFIRIPNHIWRLWEIFPNFSPNVHFNFQNIRNNSMNVRKNVRNISKCSQISFLNVRNLGKNVTFS